MTKGKAVSPELRRLAVAALSRLPDGAGTMTDLAHQGLDSSQRILGMAVLAAEGLIDVDKTPGRPYTYRLRRTEGGPGAG